MVTKAWLIKFVSIVPVSNRTLASFPLMNIVPEKSVVSFDSARASGFNLGRCIAFEFQGVDVYLFVFAMLFRQVRGCFLFGWCFPFSFVILARAVPCHMSLTSAGKTGSFLWLLSAIGLRFYIELFFGLWFLFFGSVIQWLVILRFPIGSCASMNRVYSFCRCYDCVDVFFSSVLDFNILAKPGVHAGEELLYKSIIANGIFW